MRDANIPRRAAVFAAAALAGCSVLPKRPYQERRAWPLEVARPAALPPDPRGKILLIRDLRAGPALESRALRSLQPDGSVRADPWEEWAVPPADAVSASLAAWLAASGLFAAVVAPGSRLAPDVVIEGEISALIAEPAAGLSRISLTLAVLASGAGRDRPILQRVFTGEAKLASGDGPAIAASSTAALAAVLGDVEHAMAAMPRGPQ